MAEIDYAFVADFARVDPQGTLTSVGASWTFITVKTFPAAHRMSVAGRVRSRLSEGAVPLQITVTSPDDDGFSLTAQADLRPAENARPYDGDKIGHLFALDLQVPLPKPGLYRVLVELPDSDVKRMLAFEAVSAG